MSDDAAQAVIAEESVEVTWLRGQHKQIKAISKKSPKNERHPSSTRDRERLYLACPASKAPEYNTYGHPDKCSYRGRGFKCMTQLTRHFRNQHSLNVRKCNRCCRFFLNPEDCESHETSTTCTREGIQKGSGQVRLWKELYTAIYPGKPIPESPYYHTASSSPLLPKSDSPPSDAQDTTPVSHTPAIQVQETSQHRQLVLQTIDILRHNVSSGGFDSVTSENRAMIGIMHDLLELVQKTSLATTKNMQPPTPKSSMQGPALLEGEGSVEFLNHEQEIDFMPGIEVALAAPSTQVKGLDGLFPFDQFAAEDRDLATFADLLDFTAL